MNSARTSRAIGGQLTSATAVITEPKDGWKIATSTMANRKLGMVWKISVTRISSSSQRPPR
ncbi:hypothetical protein FQZ97_521630 [compost metagenome]